MSTIYTIGHSRHEIEQFVALLNQFAINCVIDVRSAPYSQIAPQFNKPALQSTLPKNKILYAHFAKEFGARQTRPSLLDEAGKVDFDKVRASETFKRGIQRLKEALAQGYQVALMCSEANPFDCHRFSLIAYQLVRHDWRVCHILPEGQAIDNEVLEERLLKKYAKRLPTQSSFFEVVTKESQLEQAYRLRGQDVAFSVLKAYPDEMTD